MIENYLNQNRNVLGDRARKSSSIDVVPSKSSSKDVLMGDQLDIPSCFVKVPRGYFCNVCKTTIAPSPDNSISRTIQKLRTHTSSKSHLRVASNQKITPFLRPGSKQASRWNNNWYTHNRQGWKKKAHGFALYLLRHLKHHKEKEMLDREREDLQWRSVLSTICLPSVGWRPRMVQ